MRRDSAPSREAGKVAPTIPSRSTAGGGLGTDFDCDGGVVRVCPTLRAGGNSTGGDRPPGTDVDTADSLQVVAYGGNNTAGPIDQAAALNANRGCHNPGDFEAGTLLTVTHALRGEGFDASEDGTGRGTPLVPVTAVALTASRSSPQCPNEDTTLVPLLQTYAKTHKPASTTDAEGWSPVEASPTITHWFRDRSDTGTDVAVVQSIGVTLHGTDGTQSVASFTDLSSSLRARIPSGVENSTTTAVLQPVVPVAHVETMPTMLNGANTPAGHNARSGHTKDQYIVPVAQPYTLAIRGRGDTHQLEYRQDGTANALLTPNGGRGGIGVGAIAQPVPFDTSHNQTSGQMRDQYIVPVAHTFTGDGIVADPISANEGRTYTHEGSTFRLHNCVGMPEVQVKDVVALQDVRDVNKAQNGRGWNDDGAAYTVDTHATQGVAVRNVSQTITSNYGKQVDSSDTALGPNVVFPAMQVRRLTPTECERLQGFPDDYTAIPWRGKPASECPDGPRYKALGNSWAVPVVRWIGARIQRNLT